MAPRPRLHPSEAHRSAFGSDSPTAAAPPSLSRILAPHSPRRAAAAAFGRDSAQDRNQSCHLVSRSVAPTPYPRFPVHTFWPLRLPRLFESPPPTYPTCGWTYASSRSSPTPLSLSGILFNSVRRDGHFESVIIAFKGAPARWVLDQSVSASRHICRWLLRGVRTLADQSRTRG